MSHDLVYFTFLCDISRDWDIFPFFLFYSYKLSWVFLHENPTWEFVRSLPDVPEGCGLAGSTRRYHCLSWFSTMSRLRDNCEQGWEANIWSQVRGGKV